MAKSMLILWTIRSLILQVVEGGRSAHVPAMFIFGDSLADAGTNNYIPNCTARADFSPYGVSSFLSPTGRFTNGLTVFDFVERDAFVIAATQLELPLIPPYRELPFNQSIYSYGANFASRGSGLLDSTGLQKGVVKLSDQISKFEEFSKRIRKKSYLSNSLYCISSGGNDIKAHLESLLNGSSLTQLNISSLTHTTSYLQLNPTSLIETPFVNSLVRAHRRYIQRLHRAGARNFLILDISAVGCTPSARLKRHLLLPFFDPEDNGMCEALGNTVAPVCSDALKSLLDQLNEKLEGVNIILLNSFHYLENMYYDGKAFGFSETKSACCGSGLYGANVSCGLSTPPDLYCDDPDTHLFWDAMHPTQKAYSIFAEEIWGGNSSVMYPFNLSTLIFGLNKQ
ncbi:GDSL esterase/lipase 6-like [Cryptomeria japonica]|uniref:GDSL esterase/lipase 6-like n=1 Tax=Cryptomeria japonica TaxID=3369 RepID=UPI0025AD7D18|nr:GDSL esterase/lipase 6-like [Cryptomeria japonica]